MSKTIGVSVNDRELREIIEEFDKALDCGPNGERSRSDQIKVAMSMWMQIAPYVEEAGYDIGDRRAVGGAVRQAAIDHFRSERSAPDM